MPRIPDLFLNCPFYIYKSLADAKDPSSRTGASGFWVAARFDRNPDCFQQYAITNSHVITKCGVKAVIRINMLAGGLDFLDTDTYRWVHHPDGSDIAAITLDAAETHKITAIPREMFITKEIIAQNGIGPGDETFMVGRFVNHEGRHQNAPALRFGNIAMMPDEGIMDEAGILQESFLVECRSIPGYSGSPVFTYIPPHALRPYSIGWMAPSGGSLARGPWLLGIDWCHIPNFDPVLEKNKRDPVYEQWVVKSNTGMAGVIPAWKLDELLDCDNLRSAREEEDEKISKRKEKMS